MHTIEHETNLSVQQVKGPASVTYSEGNMGASVSSGSFITDGMVIVPCSMRSLAAIALGTGDHLVHRAADVILKERRRLVLVAREMPLSDNHRPRAKSAGYGNRAAVPAAPRKPTIPVARPQGIASSSGEHTQTIADGRDDHAADARLLQSSRKRQ